MKIGFDNDKYLHMQSEHIKERINHFGDKLYLEFGGKLYDDYHASRVLPGFMPDSKLRMLLQLKDQAEMVIAISAGAIASIAFGIAVPAVDGNVLRVISRILCCGDDTGLPQTKQSFRQLLLPVVPQHSAGDFNQALMELGATVCLPSSARCLLCPLAALCRAHQEGCTQQYPVKAPKKARQIQQRTLFAILCRTAEGTFTLLHRRPDSGLLAGLWEIPSVEGALTEEQAQQAAAQLLEPFDLSVLSVQPPARHIFTHIEWQMSCLLVKTGDNTLSRSQIDRLLPEDFLLTDRLDSVSLPSAFQSYTSLLTTLIGSY